MILFALSLFFTEPAPLDMPRAEAYLVRENGISFLEDRFNSLDLWTTQAVIGRWVDEQDRLFMLSSLAVQPPSADWMSAVTRGEYDERRVKMPRVRANADFPRGFREAVALLAPCPIIERPRSPRQLPHGYKYVYYWQNPTNYCDIVCTFRPDDTNAWYLASWSLAPDDDYPMQMTAFEDQFLRKEFPSFVSRLKSTAEGPETLDGRRALDGRRERELLRRDARHSIAAYQNWHFTGAEEFAVLDDLPSRGFIETLTNDFPVMRAKYAAALPTPLNGSNVLCVARIYATRDEYLDALETDGLTNMTWSAAYWSPQRRELVAYLPPDGGQELLKTIRHEAFHQYLSYATSMIPTSPWLNEGYAQYFEDGGLGGLGGLEGLGGLGGLEGLGGLGGLGGLEGLDGGREEVVDRMAAMIPGLLFMDYEQFYGGSDFERRLKYRLAWSVVRFIEKGADEVRLKPFAGLKQRYMEALLDTRDMRRATSAAFKGEDLLKKFIAEWKKFWRKQ